MPDYSTLKGEFFEQNLMGDYEYKLAYEKQTTTFMTEYRYRTKISSSPFHWDSAILHADAIRLLSSPHPIATFYH